MTPGRPHEVIDVMRIALCTTFVVIGLSCSGCGEQRESTAARVMDATAAADQLVNRVWIRSDSDDLPGRKLIFLNDGTLVQDSCWETYRLSNWRREPPDVVTWSEDAAVTKAQVMSVSANELVLRMVMPNEPAEQRYRVATVPYVCPDMKK